MSYSETENPYSPPKVDAEKIQEEWDKPRRWPPTTVMLGNGWLLFSSAIAMSMGLFGPLASKHLLVLIVSFLFVVSGFVSLLLILCKLKWGRILARWALGVQGMGMAVFGVISMVRYLIYALNLELPMTTVITHPNFINSVGNGIVELVFSGCSIAASYALGTASARSYIDQRR